MPTVARHLHVTYPVGEGRLPVVYAHRCPVCRVPEYLGIRFFLGVCDALTLLLNVLLGLLVLVTGPLALLAWSGVYSAGPTEDLVWISLFAIGAYGINGSIYCLIALLNRIQLPVCLDRWTSIFRCVVSGLAWGQFCGGVLQCSGAFQWRVLVNITSRTSCRP